ncbi:hypothetical protein [Luteibacter sp. CQ10]|uniref:hypothetical protein n=1 Tax=Luteibacter sp. CQ10 TaxID=2805821 RepID=UPI0034A591B1
MADESSLPVLRIITTEPGRLGVRDVSVDPEDRLVMWIGPLHRVPEGTLLSVFINDIEVPVDIENVPATPDTPQQVIISGIRVQVFERIPDGPFTARYTWKYPDGTEATSPTADYSLKRTVPGNPGEPIGARTNAGLQPLAYSPRLISPDSSQVSFVYGPWENASAGDQAELMLNGKTIKIEPILAGQFEKSFRVSLDRERLVAIGTGMVEATWSVRDDHGNWSLYAPTVTIPLAIEDESLPPAPNLLKPGSSADEPDIFEQGSTIEIDKFSDAKEVVVSVAAPASWVQKLRDLLGITLFWHGIDADGTAWEFEIRKDVRSMIIPRFTIPFDRFVQLGNGGRLVLSCVLEVKQGDEKVFVKSNIAAWEISGVVESTIEASMAPIIAQADAYSRTLKLIEEMPTVTVSTGSGWLEGDIIELVVNGDSDKALRQVVDASGARPFEVAEDIYVPTDREVIALQYTVRRGGARMTSSMTSYTWEDRRAVPLGEVKIEDPGTPMEVEYASKDPIKVPSDAGIGDKIGEIATDHDGNRFPTVIRILDSVYEGVRNRRGPQPSSTSVLYAVETVPGLSLRLQRWPGVDPAEPSGPKPHKRGWPTTGGNFGKTHPYKIEFIKTGELKLPFVLKAGALMDYEMGANHNFGTPSHVDATDGVGRSKVVEHHVLMNDLAFE